MKHEVSIVRAKVISHRPFQVEIENIFLGSPANAISKFINAVKEAQDSTEEEIHTVSLFDHLTSESCHIEIQHSLINVKLADGVLPF